ncbi:MULTISPECIES: hypothetical protein [Aestuariimicrobium]|uniref:hypothetical protein n=1 Tax=Aestuariimicrobium TaxID=396388 RepID=UPI0012F8797E|nr:MULTISPECIES: hypothetical protein [Aestuariimicrobium]
MLDLVGRSGGLLGQPADRGQRDVVVKLDTGGGKTVLGLIIARSWLAEGKGPLAYLVPNKYVVDQGGVSCGPG